MLYNILYLKIFKLYYIILLNLVEFKKKLNLAD